MPYDPLTTAKATPGNGVQLEAGLSALFSASRRLRYLVVFFWIAAAIAGAWATVMHLTVETDSSKMITDRAPFRQASTAFNAAFPALDDRIVMLVEAGSPDAAQAVTAALAERLAADATIEEVFAPSADPFFLEHGLFYRSVSELESLLVDLNDAAPLIERLGPDPDLAAFFDAMAEAASFAAPGTDEGQTVDELFASVAETMEAASGGGPAPPMSWQSLFREDLSPPFREVLTVTPRLDYTKLKPARPAIEAISAAADSVTAATRLDAEVMLTGDPVLRAEELDSVSRGIGLAFLVSGIAVVFLLMIALQSITLALSAFAAVLISIVVTAGLAAMTVAPLNLVSIAFTVLLVGLGVDFAVHFLLHVRAEASDGRQPAASLYRTARIAGAGLMLTAPTTALAFLAFSPTEFVGMRQLGIVAGAGVMISFLVAMTLLPAIVSIRPRRRKPLPIPEPSHSRALYRIGGYLVLLLCLPALWLAPKAKFDADPMSLRDAQAPSVTTFNLLFDDADMVPLRLDALAPDEATALALAEELRALPTVRQTRTLANFVPDAQDTKLDLLDFAALGVNAALAAPSPAPRPVEEPLAALREALDGRDGAGAAALRSALSAYAGGGIDSAATARLEDLLLRFWPRQHAILTQQMAASPVTRDSLPPEIAARYVALDGRWRVEILPQEDLRDETARAAFVSEVTAVAPGASGGARSTMEAGSIVQRSIVIATVLALALVTLLLLVVLRDLVVIVMLLIPLGMAAVLTTATGVLLDIPYNYANVIVLPLILGIGIDSGIHLALKARRQYPETARVHAVTARAVLFSALTTIASFGSLAFSPHDGTASMGLLLMIGIAWTLAATLLFLPILARWLHRNGGKGLPAAGDDAYFSADDNAEGPA